MSDVGSRSMKTRSGSDRCSSPPARIDWRPGSGSGIGGGLISRWQRLGRSGSLHGGIKDMKEIRPPEPLSLEPGKSSVFLAGSIEMGAAVEWQAQVADALRDLDVIVLNPRREAWDATWPQSIHFAPFREQVECDLEAQERADLLVFYFAPDTRAPITLLELGLAARRRAIVCCPDGYWRKGNLDVVCRRYGIVEVPTLGDLIERSRAELAVQRP